MSHTIRISDKQWRQLVNVAEEEQPMSEVLDEVLSQRGFTYEGFALEAQAVGVVESLADEFDMDPDVVASEMIHDGFHRWRARKILEDHFGNSAEAAETLNNL